MSISLDRTALVASAGFVLTLSVLEWIVFSEYRAYIVAKVTRTNTGLFLSLVLYTACVLASWVYVYLSLTAHRLVRILYFVPFALALAYEYAYQDVFGRFSTIQDVSLIFITTRTQQMGAISSYFSTVAIFPCLAYLILLAASRTRATLKNSMIVFASTVLILAGSNLFVWLVATRFFTVDSVLTSLAAADRSTFGYAFSRYLTYNVDRETVPQIRADQRPANNIVLILDESVAADHLSINGYHRATTPYLEELETAGLLKNYGIAISSSTRSLDSFRLLMSGLTHEDIEDIESKVERYPTIFQYAKAMGYKTAYYDGQIDLFWGGRPDDLRYIDRFVNVDHVKRTGDNDYDSDLRIAESVNELITSSTGNFIFVFKHGNHVPYESNFPAGNAVWLPSAPESRYTFGAADREVIINTYDNAIKYNLDRFFMSLVRENKEVLKNTVFLYTSDHGQTLSENGEQYTHGGRTLREAQVPLFVVGKTIDKLDTSFNASHSNIFATLLDLMQFPVEQRFHRYSVSLFEATGESSGDRYYFVPELERKEVIRVPSE